MARYQTENAALGSYTTLSGIQPALEAIHEALVGAGLTSTMTPDYGNVVDRAGGVYVTPPSDCLGYRFNDGVGDDIYIGVKSTYNTAYPYYATVRFEVGIGVSMASMVAYVWWLRDVPLELVFAEACFKDSSLALRINALAPTLYSIGSFGIDRKGSASGSPADGDYLISFNHLRTGNIDYQAAHTVVNTSTLTQSTFTLTSVPHLASQDGVVPVEPITWASDGSMSSALSFTSCSSILIGDAEELAVNDGTVERTYRTPARGTTLTGSKPLMRWEA